MVLTYIWEDLAFPSALPLLQTQQAALVFSNRQELLVVGGVVDEDPCPGHQVQGSSLPGCWEVWWQAAFFMGSTPSLLS